MKIWISAFTVSFKVIWNQFFSLGSCFTFGSSNQQMQSIGLACLTEKSSAPSFRCSFGPRCGLGCFWERAFLIPVLAGRVQWRAQGEPFPAALDIYVEITTRHPPEQMVLTPVTECPLEVSSFFMTRENHGDTLRLFFFDQVSGTISAYRKYFCSKSQQLSLDSWSTIRWPSHHWKETPLLNKPTATIYRLLDKRGSVGTDGNTPVLCFWRRMNDQAGLPT